MRKAGTIKLEVDSSSDPNSDFDILCFKHKEKELVFIQVDLNKREIKTKDINLPPGLSRMDKVMST